MGVHLRPVGPLPAQVYWRRRLLVLGLLVLVLVGALAGLGAAFGGRPPAAPAPAPAASTGPASPVPRSTPVASARPGPGGSPPPCTLSDATVRAATDAGSYRVGDWPRFRLDLRGTGQAPCTADIRPGRLEISVVSGADRVWSSAECPLPRPLRPVLVRPGAAAVLQSNWPARRSTPGCRGPVQPARPGTYRLVVQVSGEEVLGSAFRLLPR